MQLIFIAIVAYVIYLYASRETRRDKAVETRVRRMLGARTEYAEFNEVYFEAAKAYAIAKGGGGDDRAASADVMIAGQPLSVTFVRDNGGGTVFMIESVAKRNAWLHSSMGVTSPSSSSKPIQQMERTAPPEAPSQQKMPTKEELVGCMKETLLEMKGAIDDLAPSEKASLFALLKVPMVLNRTLPEEDSLHYAIMLSDYLARNVEDLAAKCVDEIIGKEWNDFQGKAGEHAFAISVLLLALEMIGRRHGVGPVNRAHFSWIEFRALPERIDESLSDFPNALNRKTTLPIR